MNPLDLQLQSLAKCLSEQKIKYVILGGVAVSFYGEPRLTADIDVNILFDKGKIKEFLKVVRRYGFYPAFENIEEIVRETAVIPLGFKKGKILGKFDIIIAENPLEFAAIKRGKLKKISSIKMSLISAEDLVLHKITSCRPRDLEDLRGILIRQKGRLDIGYIKTWLGRIDKVSREAKLSRLFGNLLKERVRENYC